MPTEGAIWTRESVFKKVRDVLTDTLGVDEDEVIREACLGSDLGADSTDQQNIAFHLEKACGVRIRAEDLRFDPSQIVRKDDFDDGGLTKKGADRLRILSASWVDRDALRVGATQDELFTVNGICETMERMLMPTGVGV